MYQYIEQLFWSFKLLLRYHWNALICESLSYLYSDVTVLAVPPRPEHSPPRSLPIPCWGRPGAPAGPLWWECLRGEDSGEDRADGGV